MSNFLVATDGSESASRAVAVAARMAAHLKADLTILSSVERSVTIDIRRFAAVEHETVGDAIEELCAGVLKRARGVAAEAGVRAIREKRVTGDPVSAILAAANEMKPELIIVGRRGHSQLGGLVLGSVSQKLASTSPFPVLIVP